MYFHNLDDKYPSRDLNPVPLSFEPKPDRMSHRRPRHFEGYTLYRQLSIEHVKGLYLSLCNI